MISEILKRQSEKRLQEELEKKPAPKRKRGRPKKVIDPNAPKPRKRKPGRPRKRKKRKDPNARKQRRAFEETRVGYFLMYEAPLEYQLICECNTAGTPSADLIEQVGYGSLNPLFKKPKFRKALKEYRETGLYPKYPKEHRANTELYYMKIRKTAEKNTAFTQT